MINSKKAACLLSAAVVLSQACAGTGECDGKQAGAAALAGGYNQFGLRLFVREAESAGDGNVFISPASVALCLGMAYNGAGGSTAEEMAELLGAGSMDLSAYNTASGNLTDSLSDSGAGITLSIANSLWLRENFPVREEYTERTRKHFGAGVHTLESAKEINGWVKEKTEGMIDAIIDSVDPADIAILVNAIYFKGIWTVEFDRERTEEKPFHTPGGDRKVPMMRRRGDLQCVENDLFQAVRLTYGESSSGADTGGGASMYILLPSPGKKPADLTGRLTPRIWKEWTGSLALREGTIELPRFRAEYFTKLNGTLSSMGMNEAFERTADFTKLCRCKPGDVYISDVFHKAVVDVSEEGTEAAAATAVKMKLTSSMPAEKPFHMIVDRPFLLAIVDDDTGLILFIGAIRDPGGSATM